MILKIKNIILAVIISLLVWGLINNCLIVPFVNSSPTKWEIINTNTANKTIMFIANPGVANCSWGSFSSINVLFKIWYSLTL